MSVRKPMLLVFAGPNGSGKTSFSEALEYGLLGNIEEAESNHDDYDTEIGHLVIPQKYRVAYIIDGQHRLMGYAGCKWENQQIPVVAFERLNKATQVKLFMEMNENQKAVPKELRLTLYKDLLPTDPRLSQRMYGLRLQIAFSFADHKNSPLKGYVLYIYCRQ